MRTLVFKMYCKLLSDDENTSEKECVTNVSVSNPTSDDIEFAKNNCVGEYFIHDDGVEEEPTAEEMFDALLGVNYNG